jgi:hypothetical protein
MMRSKPVVGACAALLLAIPVSGCGTGQMVQTAYGPMPDYCMGNNAAAGAALLGLVGAVAGAAIGGSAESAALGGLAGAAVGGVGGAQVDAQCRQLAAQRAMEMALAQQAAVLAEQANRRRYRPVSVDMQVAYVTQDGHHHKAQVTQLNSFANPAAVKGICTTGSGSDADLDGKTYAAIATPKMCLGPDGKWAPA